MIYNFGIMCCSHREFSMRVLQWNAGGISQTKRSELLQSLKDHDIDVFTVMEANLTPEKLQYFPFDGYNLFILPKSRQVASGILAGVKKGLLVNFKIIKDMNHDSDKSEVILLDVWKHSAHFKIYAIYNPPNNKPSFTYLNISPRTIMMGDFNAHSPTWGYQDENDPGREVEDLLNSSSLELIYDPSDLKTFLHYNGKSFNPDLLLVSSDISSNTKRQILDDPGSGHRQVIAEVTVTSPFRGPSSPKTSWNFKKANWNRFRELADLELDPSKINWKIGVDSVTKLITNKIIQCAKKCIPRGKSKAYRIFWTEELRTMRDKRNRFRKRAEATERPSDVQAWRKQAALFRKTVLTEKRSSFNNFLSNMNFQRDGKKAYKFLANIKNGNSDIAGKPFAINDRTITSHSKIANAFAQHFARIQQKSKFCNKQSKSLKKTIKAISNSTHKSGSPLSIFSVQITLNELSRAIKLLKANKSPGDDAIHAEFLLHLGAKAERTILKLFNFVWNTGYTPSLWRKSIIIPIHKKGKDRGDIKGYRPVSLTSILCKTMERIIVGRLNWYIEYHGILVNEQAGFRQFRSTGQHVALLSQMVKDALDKKHILSAVFVDLKSAYDLVCRESLLLKLSNIGVNSNMFNWFRSFLSQRICRVRFENCFSHFKNLKTGLPQGAVTSCLLFNIYINDLIAELTSINNVRCLLYADDLVIWTEMPKKQAKQQSENTLNQALNKLSDWCHINNMEVNLEKSVYQTFSLTHQPIELNLFYQNLPILQTNLFSYLGVIFDRKLSWKAHVLNVVDRATKRLTLMKRIAGSKWGCCRTTLDLTYKSYILPLITYCSEPLAAAGKQVIDALERLHNQALRLITGAVKTTPIDALLISTQHMSIKAVIEEKALILWEKMARLPDCFPLWNFPLSTTTRNLKTQKGFLQKVFERKEQLGLSWEMEDLIRTQCPTEEMKYMVKLNLSSEVSKKQTNDQVLRVVALETIHDLYPDNEWLHVFTDGSMTNDCINAGAGVSCKLFSFCSPVGRYKTAFDAEISAIQIALSQLQCHSENFSRAVILSDSRAALLAISSLEAPASADILAIRLALNDFILNHKEVVLQWVPAHCGVQGNETADSLAKKATKIVQITDKPIPFYTAKRLVKRTYREAYWKDIMEKNKNKKWIEEITNIPLWPRDKSVAIFRLVTGHDCLSKHLYRFKILSSPLCQLCNTLEEMDMDHLSHCPVLSTGRLWERYWRARHKMNDL